MQIVAIIVVVLLLNYIILAAHEEIIEGIIVGGVYIVLGVWIIVLCIWGVSFVAVLVGYGQTRIDWRLDL